MASQYRTARKKIVDALVEKIRLIDGNFPYNSNIFNNAHGGMVFLDEITEYPKVCVVSGDEIREYPPGEFKWRFLSLYKSLCRRPRRPSRGLSSINGRH